VKGFGCRPVAAYPPVLKGPASESLQGRNPRWAARAVAVYGDLTAGRRARVTRWARELVVDRRLQPAERFRCCFRGGDFGVMGGIEPAFGGHDATELRHRQRPPVGDRCDEVTAAIMALRS
jgi:hypothetical protein